MPQQSSTTTLFQAPLFQTARRHQALITSPVILLMLAACSSSSNVPISANPTATDNGDNGDNGSGDNNGDSGAGDNDGDNSTSPAGAGSAPTVAQVLEEFQVFTSVEGNITIAGPTHNAVSYASDPEGVPADPDDDDTNPASAINGVDVNLTVGEAIDGWNDTDALVDIELVHGSAYDDRLIGNGNNNRFFGGAGNDRLTGQGGFNLLNGGSGNDIFVGSDAGVNVVTYHTDPTGIYVDLARNTAFDGWGEQDSFVDINHIVGSYYTDIIYGNEFSNNLSGGHGNDVIYGLAGDDTLVGGAGIDHLFGGDDADFVSYVADINGVTVNLAEGTATDGWGDTDWLTDIENVHGSEHDDVITGDHANTANGWTLEQIRTNLNLSITSANGNIVISSAGSTHDFEMTLENVLSLEATNFEFF